MVQHRANPIPETLEHVPGLPDHVVIYKIPASSFWYSRASFDGKRVPHSLKTTSHATAMAEAKKWYINMLVKHETGQPLTSGSDFKRAAEALLVDEKERVRAGERKQSLVDDFEYIYEKDLLRFFKSVPLRSIDKAKIAEYLTDIGQRNLSSRTKKNHLMHLTKILAKAEDLKLIDQMPTFPKIKLQQTPREWFDTEAYHHLLKTMDKIIEEKPIIKRVPTITEHLRHLTEFMVGTFLRVTDIKNLKNKDITVMRKPDHTYLKIMAYGKVTPSPVFSTEAAVYLYERYLKGDPDAYVFFPQYERSTAMGVMAKQFAYVVKKAGLYYVEGSNRKTRDLTSLRHTAIMRQLNHSRELPLAVLAKNCRTSIEIIQKFYGSHVEAERSVKLMYQEDGPTASVADFFEEDEPEAAQT